MDSPKDTPVKLETAAEFGRRHVRETRRTRFWFGLIAGVVVAFYFLMRLARHQPLGAVALIACGAIALGVALFFRNAAMMNRLGWCRFFYPDRA